MIDLNKSDVDAHADFVLGVARTVAPATRQTRSANPGLGPPIA